MYTKFEVLMYVVLVYGRFDGRETEYKDEYSFRQMDETQKFN